MPFHATKIRFLNLLNLLLQVEKSRYEPEQVCVDVDEQKCHTKYEKDCHTEYDQKCHTEYEK